MVAEGLVADGRHQDSAGIRIISVADFAFDPRLFPAEIR
jgi:hypothetical protein